MKKLLITCVLVSICGVTPLAYANDSLNNSPDQTIQTSSVTVQQPIKDSDKAKYDKLCNKANTLIDKKKYNEADVLLQKAISITPELDMTYALKAKIYIKQNNCNEAKKEAEKALVINSENDVANNVFGICLLKEKNYTNALIYFNKALKSKPNAIKYIINIACTYSNMTDYEKAIEYFSKAIQLATTDDLMKYDMYTLRSDLYLATKQDDRALLDANTAIKLNSKNYMAYSIKAKILANKNDYINAFKYANKAVKLSKGAKNADLYLDRIYVYLKSNRTWSPVVDNDFTLAEKYAKDDILSLPRLASTYSDAGKYDDACRIYKKILELDPKNHPAILNYTNALIRQQNYEQSLSILEDLKKNNLELINTDEQVKKVFHANIGCSQYGVAKLNDKTLIKEAIENFKVANTQNNKNYSIGNGYFILGDYKNAYEYYKKQIKYNKELDFSTVYKLLLLKKLSVYSSYSREPFYWGVPEWIVNDKEIPEFGWENILDAIKNDVIARVNYSNAGPIIQDKNYILSTIQMLRLKKYGVGKVYNLHIDDESLGNTSRIVVYPFINALDDKASSINNEDYNLILANQYFLLIRNSLMHIPQYYRIDEADISNFFSSIENIPSKTAVNYIVDLTALSLAEWDIFVNEEVSLSFYNNMISYLKSKGLDKSSNKIKERIKAAYLGMGDYYLENKRMNEAIYYYNSAIPYGISAFDINKYIGNYYFDKDNYFKAIEYFSKALSNKNDAEIYLKRGYAKSKMKDYDGAVSDYNKAIGYNKNFKLAYWERAQVLFEQKKYSIAFNDYVKYSSLDKKDAAAQYNAGICLYNTGKKQAALPYLNRAKSLAQSSGNTQLYNKSINLINEIKGYSRRYY